MQNKPGMTSAKCSACRGEVTENAAYCPHCGAPVEARAEPSSDESGDTSAEPSGAGGATSNTIWPIAGAAISKGTTAK
jgi:endogenous inhibitor of DNA gyrase (YacG/DUF329 family)